MKILPWKAVRRGNAVISKLSLAVARFITQMGSTRAETCFWRVGAGISALGAAIVLAGELGTIAFLLTISGSMGFKGWGHLLLHAGGAFILAHFIVAIVRGIREPHHSQSPERNPKS